MIKCCQSLYNIKNFDDFMTCKWTDFYASYKQKMEYNWESNKHKQTGKIELYHNFDILCFLKDNYKKTLVEKMNHTLYPVLYHEDFIDLPKYFNLISSNKFVSTEFIEKYIDKAWDFDALSKHPSITINIIIKNQSKEWNWSELIKNKNISVNDILQNKHLPWEFESIVFRDDLPLETFFDLEKNEKIPKLNNYDVFYYHDKISEYIQKNWCNIDIMNYFVKHDIYPNPIILSNNINWRRITHEIPWEFIKKHLHWNSWCWEEMHYNTTISVEMINEMISEISKRKPRLSRDKKDKSNLLINLKKVQKGFWNAKYVQNLIYYSPLIGEDEAYERERIEMLEKINNMSDQQILSYFLQDDRCYIDYEFQSLIAQYINWNEVFRLSHKEWDIQKLLSVIEWNIHFATNEPFIKGYPHLTLTKFLNIFSSKYYGNIRVNTWDSDYAIMSIVLSRLKISDDELAQCFYQFSLIKKIVRKAEECVFDPEHHFCKKRLEREFKEMNNEIIE